jgi:hypothetical protein
MNPGLPEEGAKVATGLIDALKQSPMTLAMVVFNLVFIVIVYYGINQARSASNEMFLEIRNTDSKLIAQLTEQQTKTAELLYRCTPGH